MINNLKDQDLVPPISSASSKLVVVVDDEPDILDLVQLHFSRAGFKIKTFENGESFFNFINKNVPDLVLLDLMLPDADGFEICKYLKKEEKFSQIPVIMLTARSEEMDKIIGLEIGADDYVTKPFSPRELLARAKAVLRRDDKVQASQKLKIAGLIEIDLQKYEVNVDEQRVELTSTEFRILRLLAERKGWVFARDQILDHIGAYDKGVLDRTVDVHIKNLREKLGPEAAKYIKNIRGIGYKIEENL